jgi:hypothetical protein
MNYFILIAGFLFLFVVCFLTAGILGRGWFFFPADKPAEKT